MRSLIVCLVLVLSAFVVDMPGQEAAKTVAGEKIVTVEDAAAGALKAGAEMPGFALKDAFGKVVKSDELLRDGSLVIVFYRGSWCPFCNLYLRNLQKRVGDIAAAGGRLVAISVETPDASMAVAKKNELNYTVLSDPNLDTARKFGIVYQMSAETAEAYRARGLDVAKHNQMERPELPLGATYVVNKKGRIVYAFLETDYKKRAEPDVIIESLKKAAP